MFNVKQHLQGERKPVKLSSDGGQVELYLPTLFFSYFLTSSHSIKRNQPVFAKERNPPVRTNPESSNI